MQLKELQKHWDQLGREDPLWAILSMPDKVNNRWTTDEFFKTGTIEIDDVMRHASLRGVPRRKDSALDFGCGVGRLTQALCRHFEKCCGVDLAPSMVKQAQKYNQYGPRCEYYRNETDGLPLFPDGSFDFVYSNLVLQHMKPEYSRRYIGELVRILATDGALVFQLPAEMRRTEPEAAERLALPEAAFKAAVQPRHQSLTAPAGSRIALSVTVTNLSSVTWPSASSCPVRLGNHWRQANGDLLSRDDERASLEHDLGPMQQIEMKLVVNAPPDPGEYLLQLDMVQEDVAWFEDRGSGVAQIRAAIGDRRRDRLAHGRKQKGLAKIEMYGIPRDDVIETVTRAGGEILAIEEDSGAGPEWLGFRYFVTKRDPVMR